MFMTGTCYSGKSVKHEFCNNRACSASNRYQMAGMLAFPFSSPDNLSIAGRSVSMRDKLFLCFQAISPAVCLPTLIRTYFKFDRQIP